MSSRPATKSSSTRNQKGLRRRRGSWPGTPFSRVRLEELSWSVLGLYGPCAREYFGDLGEHQSSVIEIEGRALLSVGVAVPVPGYDLIGPPEDLAAVRRYLTETGATIGTPTPTRPPASKPASPASAQTSHQGTSRASRRTSLERAVSFEKGCYPGQETVANALSW